MKRILVTHIDLDGAGSAILFKRRYPDIEVRYHDYDTIDEISKELSKELWENKDEYDTIFYSDITPNEEYGMKMIDHPKFTLIDHHITREYLRDAKHGNVVYSTYFCATYLTTDYLNVNTMDYERYRNFILAVDAYDMWKLDSEYRGLGLNLNLLFNYYGMKEFVKQFADMREFNNKEYIILEVLQKLDRDYLVEKLKQGKIKTDKDGYTYFEVYTAEKGGHLGVLVDDPDFPVDCEYIKVINLNDLVVGLYAKDFNVSGIAELHGGGGHRGAAGYEIKFLKDIYV
jgi:oligoribonuclease NrnB/cAMP/cGMP phosphodiesterase (DHH superfamily)